MAFLAEASARTKSLRTEGASALEAQNKGHRGCTHMSNGEIAKTRQRRRPGGP